MACPFPFTSLTAVNAGCAGCLSSPQNPQKKPLHQSASVYAAELTLGAPFHQSDSLCRPITRQTAPRGRLKINLHFFSPALVASRHHKTHKKNSAPIIETYSNMKTNQNDDKWRAHPWGMRCAIILPCDKRGPLISTPITSQNIWCDDQ